MKHLESVKRIIVLQLCLLGIGVQTAMYGYVWLSVYKDIMYNTWFRTFYFKGYVLLFAIYFLLLLFFTAMYGGLKLGYLKAFDVFFSQAFSLLFVNVISYLQISLLSLKLVNAGPMLLLFLAQVAFSAVWTFLCQRFYSHLFPPKNLLLISGDRPLDDILQKFAERKDKYTIAKCMREDVGREVLEQEIMQRYDGVILWDLSTVMRNKLLKFCYSNGVRVYMMPKIPDIIVQGATQLHLFDTPIIFTREYVMSFEQRFAKRLIDVVCSLILIIVASPFMLITAIAIKCYDGGPVLYKQIRCTKDMREFAILKFRSMRTDAEKDGVARLASKNDSRITPIGKFIRKVRIDELPQLFNILKGDMSFIGPRPERPEIIQQYLEEMPEFTFRTKVKAGLAGYAQVYGKYNTTPYDKLKLDLIYIENYSVWMDLKLMLLTLKILFQPDSTEGIDENQITAMRQMKEEEDKN